MTPHPTSDEQANLAVMMEILRLVKLGDTQAMVLHRHFQQTKDEKKLLRDGRM